MNQRLQGVDVDQMAVSVICGVVGSAMVAGGLTPLRPTLGISGIGALVGLVVAAAAVGGGWPVGLLTALTGAVAMEGYQIHSNVPPSAERRDVVVMVVIYLVVAMSARFVWNHVVHAFRPGATAH